MQDCLNKKTYNREKVIYIRLYIKRSKIATKILNILRYNVYEDKKKFDKKKEIECYKNYVEFIEKNISARNYSQFKLINDVKEKIYKKGISNDNRFNIAVFKLTQKLNLIYQKEVMNNMITILKSDSKNEIKKYEDFIRCVQNSDKIKSIYLKVEDIKTMIINYLFKMINRKNNK